MSDVHSERVLVVPTAVFHRLGHFQGFTPKVNDYLPELFRAEHISYQPRQQVEQDPSFKQLIRTSSFAIGTATDASVFSIPGARPGRGPTASQAERGNRRPYLVDRRGKRP